MKTRLLSVLAGIGFFSALSTFTQAQTYQITDIGTLGGTPTYATAVNDDGVVCGYALPTETTAKAWVFDHSTLTELPGLGGTDTRAMAVAPDGKIYGYSSDAAGLVHGVRWVSGVVSDLGPASGSAGWLAQAVNASGTVAGFTGTASDAVSGFTLSPSFTSIPILPGATPPATTAAFDLNDAGTVAGVASWVGGGTRAFRTDATGAPVSLGTLGANDSAAMGINATGDVVGYSVNAGNLTHAFIFTDGGGIRDLGVLSGDAESRAFAINDTGLVVGSSESVAGTARAFLWNGAGALVDLNPLIPPNGGWVLNDAQDINSGGDIVGSGTVGGQTHAFILERFEGADTLAPIVLGSVAVTNGAPSSLVTVNFWDNEKVVGATTHAPGMIRVTGPNGFDTVATLQSWYSADRQASTSTFIFTPPGGSWDGGDNGVYEIRLAANLVSDLAGNLHPGGVIGTFTVGMQTAPALNWITLPSTATLGVAVNLSFGAFGSYPLTPGDVFTVLVDWDGDGAVVESIPGQASAATIPHSFTSLGTHTVRVRVTDPHGVTSSERTAQCVVSNAAQLTLTSEVLSPPGSVSAYSTAATLKAGTMYFFGSPFTAAGNTSITTWNYLTPGAGFVVQPDTLDNGPIIPAGAGVDSRGRIIYFGGGEAGGSGAAAGSYPNGGGVAPMLVAAARGSTTSDNLSRIYFFSNALYRYTAGTSGNGTWATLPTTPSASQPSSLTCMSYDGGDRIIGFAGTAIWAYSIFADAWTPLGAAPAAPGRAALGADGNVYLVVGTQLWMFDGAANTMSPIGALTYNDSSAHVLKGTDGFLYFIGGGVERFDTRATVTLAPRIASTPAGTTLPQGTPWIYALAASGKPRPGYSLVRGPSGMTVNATTGLVSWTPTLAQVGTQTAVVRAANSAGSADQLINFTVLAVPPDITPPTAPTNLAAFNITISSADISWTGSTDNISVAGYRIFEKRRRYSGRGRPMTTYYAQVGATTGTSWHFSNLPQGSTRTYYVAAIDPSGNLSTKVAVTFTLQSPPALYADWSGTFQGRRAIVSEPWMSNVFTATGNPLPAIAPTASPAGAVWHAVNATSGYFTWTAVAGQEGVQAFSVTATSIAGTASLSQTVETFPAGTDLIPPTAPANLVVDQVSFESLRATWSAATDNYGIALYRVTAAHLQPRRRFHYGAYNDHVVTFTVPAGTTQVAIPGLRPSTSYVVSITAQDTAGLWSYSTSANVTTLPQPFVLDTAVVTTTPNADGSQTMTWPSYGYYWKFTVECSEDLATWTPVPPASQWPSYITTFTFTSEPGVASRFYRVKASPAAAP